MLSTAHLPAFSKWSGLEEMRYMRYAVKASVSRIINTKIQRPVVMPVIKRIPFT